MAFTKKVIGLKTSSFVDKDTGKTVEYGKLYLSIENDKDSELIGIACESHSVKPSIVNKLNLGDTVELYFDAFKKVKMVEVL